MASAFLRGALPCAKLLRAVGARTGRVRQNGFARDEGETLEYPLREEPRLSRPVRRARQDTSRASVDTKQNRLFALADRWQRLRSAVQGKGGKTDDE